MIVITFVIIAALLVLVLLVKPSTGENIHAANSVLMGTLKIVSALVLGFAVTFWCGFSIANLFNGDYLWLSILAAVLLLAVAVLAWLKSKQSETVLYVFLQQLAVLSLSGFFLGLSGALMNHFNDRYFMMHGNPEPGVFMTIVLVILFAAFFLALGVAIRTSFSMLLKSLLKPSRLIICLVVLAASVFTFVHMFSFAIAFNWVVAGFSILAVLSSLLKGNMSDMFDNGQAEAYDPNNGPKGKAGYLSVDGQHFSSVDGKEYRRDALTGDWLSDKS